MAFTMPIASSDFSGPAYPPAAWHKGAELTSPLAPPLPSQPLSSAAIPDQATAAQISSSLAFLSSQLTALSLQGNGSSHASFSDKLASPFAGKALGNTDAAIGGGGGGPLEEPTSQPPHTAHTLQRGGALGGAVPPLSSAASPQAPRAVAGSLWNAPSSYQQGGGALLPPASIAVAAVDASEPLSEPSSTTSSGASSYRGGAMDQHIRLPSLGGDLPSSSASSLPSPFATVGGNPVGHRLHSATSTLAGNPLNVNSTASSSLTVSSSSTTSSGRSSRLSTPPDEVEAATKGLAHPEPFSSLAPVPFLPLPMPLGAGAAHDALTTVTSPAPRPFPMERGADAAGESAAQKQTPPVVPRLPIAQMLVAKAAASLGGDAEEDQPLPAPRRGEPDHDVAATNGPSASSTTSSSSLSFLPRAMSGGENAGPSAFQPQHYGHSGASSSYSPAAPAPQHSAYSQLPNPSSYAQQQLQVPAHPMMGGNFSSGSHHHQHHASHAPFQPALRPALPFPPHQQHYQQQSHHHHGPPLPSPMPMTSPIHGGGGGGPGGQFGGAYLRLNLPVDCAAIADGRESRTTVMVRNIPSRYTQQLLVDELSASGFRGAFDFVYLPVDFRNGCSMGYAFINFSDPRDLIHFFSRWNGRRWPQFSSRKRCELAFARIQGKQSLVEHFQHSRTLLASPAHCRPVVFVSSGPRRGEQEPFPFRVPSSAGHGLDSGVGELDFALAAAGAAEPSGYWSPSGGAASMMTQAPSSASSSSSFPVLAQEQHFVPSVPQAHMSPSRFAHEGSYRPNAPRWGGQETAAALPSSYSQQQQQQQQQGRMPLWNGMGAASSSSSSW